MAVFQQRANHILERSIASRPVNPAPAPAPLPAPEKGALLGRLMIPRLNVRAVVREGADHDTLDVALGHIPGTAMPGQAGNVGVAGHRDTLFRGLRHVAKNDVIQFQTPAGNYSYQVESTGIVTPKDVGVLKPGREPEMTLVTCYPFNYVGPAPDRFIVKARLLTPPSATQAAVQAPPPAPAKAPVQTVSLTKNEPPPTTVAPAPPHNTRKVSFVLNASDTSEVAPGVLMGLSWTDPIRHRANGWVWMASDRHKVWVHLAEHQPLMFHHRELMLTSIDTNSVSGYLQQFP
jgi:sortase A